MKNNELAVPLRVYTNSGELIAQIGEQRRNPVTYEQIPLIVTPGLHRRRGRSVLRASRVRLAGNRLRTLFVNVTSARAPGRQHDHHAGGAQRVLHAGADGPPQAAGNIRHASAWSTKFTKQEILALYLNVIFFGQRSYGVAAAAETYFGKQLDELTLGEAATLARVPQWPSQIQPDHQSAGRGRTPRLRAAPHARTRLSSTPAAAEAASKEVVSAQGRIARWPTSRRRTSRRWCGSKSCSRFGAAAQEAGYKVYTTIDGRLQKAANHALRIGPDRLHAPARLARRRPTGSSCTAARTRRPRDAAR